MARTDLTQIEAQLAEEAKRVSEKLGAPAGRKITIDNTGNLIAPGGEILGTEVDVIVVDFASANYYYTAAYDPNNPASPVCFAFGDVINEMAPEEQSPEPQNADCRTCPHNQFGSSGNGKACKNTRELAVVLADELEDPDATPEMYMVSVSPTSLKHFDGAAKQIYRLFNGTPIKAILKMKAQQTANYFALTFTDPRPNPHLERVFPLREQVEEIICRQPDLTNYRPTKGRVAPRR